MTCINFFNTLKTKEDLLKKFYLKVSLFLIPKLLNNPLAFFPLINFDFVLLHTAHFDKSIIFRFLSLKRMVFYFLYFFTLKTIQLHCFTNRLKSVEVFKFLISSFISSYYFRTLFIIINSSRLIFESIKAVEIKTSMLFNLDFANNIILSSFSLNY